MSVPLKYILQVILTHTNACVLNLKTDPTLFFGAPSQGDAALLGKLDGITDQVVHYLTDAHAVSLDRLREMGRREVKSYLRSLDGIAPYVADRVTLLCFDAHCIPVDARLHRSLVKAGVGDETVEIPDMASWLARQVKAADALATHRALQVWSDRVGSSAARAASALPAVKAS